MNIFHALYADLPRQGPGAAAYTRRAVEAIGLDGVRDARILELGCGTGAATRVLAGAYPFSVLAVDRDPVLLARLDDAAGALALRGAIETRVADMAVLDLPDAQFDAVWSEGAAYLMGFDTAIAVWPRYLRPGGFIVASELTWLTSTPPAPARTFWAEAYPAMRTLAENLEAFRSAVPRVLDPIPVEADGMWNGFYAPLAARVAALRQGEAAYDTNAASVLVAVQAEIDLYRAYGEAYGYVFYLGQVAG